MRASKPSCETGGGGGGETEVCYYQHTHNETKKWAQVPKQGTHPIVFAGTVGVQAAGARRLVTIAATGAIAAR